MFFRNGLYLIKKNPGSTETPWLGTNAKDQEVFGSMLDFIGMGYTNGFHLKVFVSSSAAFGHIQKKYPEDVGRMQVYLAKEDSNGISLTHVPALP